ncbi:MAG: TIM barrel protein, partial [Clostridia bacterium]
MNIGISTACFYPEEPLDAIDIIGNQGFKHIEIFVNTESEFQRDYAEKFKEKIDYYGINVISVHPYTSLLEGIYFFSDYAKRTDDALKIYSHYFDYCEFMGAKFFTLHGESSILANFSNDKVERDINTYKRLCDLANSKNISVAQENVVRFSSQNIDFLENLYKKVP